MLGGQPCFRQGDLSGGSGVGKRTGVVMRLVAALLVAIVTAACATSHGVVRQDGAVMERWQNVRYFGGTLAQTALQGPCDFGRRVSTSDHLDFAIQSDRIVLSLPNWRSCPVTQREIIGAAITRLGYARRSRQVDDGGCFGAGCAVAAVVDLLRPDTVTRHFVSIDFRDVAGASASALFYLEGRDTETLLRSLSRMSGAPINASSLDAAQLAKDLEVTVSADALELLVPGVPLWQSHQVVLEGNVSHLAPDGSVALADGALWDVSTARELSRLPQRPEGPNLTKFSPDGHTLVLGHNSGPWNGEGASQAGELAIVDVSRVKQLDPVSGLPWLDRLIVSPDSARVFAFHESPIVTKGNVWTRASVSGVEVGVSAIALDRAEVVWRVSLPAERVRRDLRGADAWSTGVLAFGNEWVGVWQGTTGESLYGPSPVLQDLPPEERPSAILNAVWRDGRIIVVYGSKAGRAIASIDVVSGQTVRSDQFPTATNLFFGSWWNPDRTVLLVGSLDGLALWNTATLTMTGALIEHRRLVGWRSASFDGSGRLAATLARGPEGLQNHVVIWDVVTRTPVGQCLLDGAETIQFAPDGRAVLGFREKEVLFCGAAAEDDE